MWHVWGKQMYTEFGLENLKEKDRLEDTGTEEWIIFKLLQKYDQVHERIIRGTTRTRKGLL
jgi:hypothetical protein